MFNSFIYGLGTLFFLLILVVVMLFLITVFQERKEKHSKFSCFDFTIYGYGLVIVNKKNSFDTDVKKRFLKIMKECFSYKKETENYLFVLVPPNFLKNILKKFKT